MNNSYITIIKEKRTVLSRKRVPLNQNECTADFRIGVPFEQNLHPSISPMGNGCKLCAGCTGCMFCGPSAIAAAGAAGFVGFF